MYYVYKHTNKYNGKCYIGITKQVPHKRWGSGKGYKSNVEFTNAINKFGWDGFSHEIIYSRLSEFDAKCYEFELIVYYDSIEFGYNKTYSISGVNNMLLKRTINVKIVQYFNDKLVKVWNDVLEIQNNLNIHQLKIVRCCEGKLDNIDGFKFEYVK